MNTVLKRIVKTDRTQNHSKVSRSIAFSIIFALLNLFALTVLAKLAVTIGGGQFFGVAGADLNVWGALIVGAGHGLSQYTLLRSIVRVPIAWIAVTAIGYAIATLFPFLNQTLYSAIAIAIIGLMQVILVWNQTHFRNTWIKGIAIQIGVTIVGLIAITIAAFFIALMTIATLGKGGHWTMFSHLTSILWMGGLLMQGFVQAWSVRVWLAGSKTIDYPCCPLLSNITYAQFR